MMVMMIMRRRTTTNTTTMIMMMMMVVVVVVAVTVTVTLTVPMMVAMTMTITMTLTIRMISAPYDANHFTSIGISIVCNLIIHVPFRSVVILAGLLQYFTFKITSLSTNTALSFTAT